jgi:hypothetical protein
MGHETVMEDVLCGCGWYVTCLDCERVGSLSCDVMLERFAASIDRPMKEIAERLVCSECRSKRLWLRPFASVKIDTGHRGAEARAERELVILARAAAIVEGRA